MSAKPVTIDRSETGVAIVALKGEHETYTAQKLRQELRDLLDGGSGVVLDLTAATFLDSAVIGVILEARAIAAATGLKFAIVMDDNTGPAVQRLFDLTGLRSVLTIAETRDAALAS